MHKFARQACCNELSITQDSDTITDFKDLFETMRYVKNGNTFFLLEVLNESQKVLGIFIGKRCCWLVKNDDTRIGTQNFSNLYHLTRSKRQAGDGSSGVNPI